CGMSAAPTATAGFMTSGVLFFGEFTSGETSTAPSHSSGHGLPVGDIASQCRLKCSDIAGPEAYIDARMRKFALNRLGAGPSAGVPFIPEISNLFVISTRTQKQNPGS